MPKHGRHRIANQLGNGSDAEGMASENILTFPASQACEFVALTRRNSMGRREISAEILESPVDAVIVATIDSLAGASR